jgi:hypothetical protein
VAKKKKTPHHSSSPFKEKEKGGEGGSKAWWPMECSKLGGQWKVKEKTPFHLFHFPPYNLYPNLQFFPLTLPFYFTMVLSRYSRLPFLFFDL